MSSDRTDYLTVRVPPELRQQALRLAEEDDRPMTSWIRRLIEEHVDRHPTRAESSQ